MRKLASIQKILKLEPIENADLIEKATVLGWNLVVKKGEFQVGEQCIYCEIDSLLPERHEYEFLRPRGFRIKTAKLRGQISQGICFPMSVLDGLLPDEERMLLEEGTEVTDELGIKKYELPIPASMSGAIKGAFPGFIPKTDEIRIQSVPEVLDEFRGTSFYITEKVDGCSMTAFIRDGFFGVCSRNLELLEDEKSVFWRISRKTELENNLRKLAELTGMTNIAIQGEIIGPGIQGNKYKLAELEFRPFNLFDIDGYKYIPFDKLKDMIKSLGLEMVPVLDENFVLNHSVEELVESAKGNSLINPSVKREGLVFGSIDNVGGFEGLSEGRISFKAISNDFLLKFDE